jgi:hypothetical protein
LFAVLSLEMPFFDGVQACRLNENAVLDFPRNAFDPLTPTASGVALANSPV